MGLSNGSNKARNYNQTINIKQGGGNKKAGLPFQIGRTSWDSVYLRTENKTLALTQVTKNPDVKMSRPIGSTSVGSYWKMF